MQTAGDLSYAKRPQMSVLADAYDVKLPRAWC